MVQFWAMLHTVQPETLSSAEHLWLANHYEPLQLCHYFVMQIWGEL